MIHPTAIIDPGADIGPDVQIGAYSIIGDKVSVGAGTVIGPHAVIQSHTTIGSECRIFQFAAIGAVPQALKFSGEETYVKIGNRCTIREFVTVHRGTVEGSGLTEIGDDCLLMAYTHVAHDCRVGKRVIFSNNATLAGHITVGDYATIGGLVAVHQFVKIGSYAFIGGKSAVVKDIPPYVIAAGDRAKLYGLNMVGLKRHDFSPTALSALKKAYRIIFRIGLTLNEAVERAYAEVEQTDEVKAFMDFITSSNRGLTR
ncbi:acyl-ACP--UDP-N-acetylglucosamine O-acyltransferase [Desulfosudis oleivorans]|uniref:Acyl-[acyl-carrier-protein]--UDP-N-acetylglucosamine O-acyltransferase n=1 Tax=Desulfosudis oleivorans (strain DSM 6200 / JCM 39069 / Hxd3) TaxID=96561 RepID=A8ZY16_DESOH|nr:acyl-ACP--UDP-N-acetylglucosamine O-acyltransferase [Desulfosudis oleivorans]ABW68643.1 acyl-(acyl-carrier-protein)--UDP-N-acetylglucosamine O-acyltransferase [Desulfosudis oleivorans Hxd3]